MKSIISTWAIRLENGDEIFFRQYRDKETDKVQVFLKDKWEELITFGKTL